MEGKQKAKPYVLQVKQISGRLGFLGLGRKFPTETVFVVTHFKAQAQLRLLSYCCLWLLQGSASTSGLCDNFYVPKPELYFHRPVLVLAPFKEHFSCLLTQTLLPKLRKKLNSFNSKIAPSSLKLSCYEHARSLVHEITK